MFRWIFQAYLDRSSGSPALTPIEHFDEWPRSAWRLLARGLREERRRRFARCNRRLRRIIGGDRVNRLAQLFAGNDADEMYRQAMRLSELQLTPQSTIAEFTEVAAARTICCPTSLCGTWGYLPGDILVKLDRASMATSLEARCPILDHRVVEFAWRLPNNAKVRDGQGKWILRQVLGRYLPRHVIDRPKQGFDVPDRSLVERARCAHGQPTCCPNSRLQRQSLLDAPRVQSCWQDHLSGRRDHSRMPMGGLDVAVMARHDGWAKCVSSGRRPRARAVEERTMEALVGKRIRSLTVLSPDLAESGSDRSAAPDDGAHTLKRVLDSIRKYRRLVRTIIVVGTLLVAAISLLIPATYLATAQLAVDVRQSGAADAVGSCRAPPRRPPKSPSSIPMLPYCFRMHIFGDFSQHSASGRMQRTALVPERQRGCKNCARWLVAHGQQPGR